MAATYNHTSTGPVSYTHLYRRRRERDGQRAPRGLLPLFLGENEPDDLNCRAKALALCVRQYDTTGRGVFVFSTSESGTS